MNGKKKGEREGEVRAFKSKTLPLLVDTTVLFPPKKGKGRRKRKISLRIFSLSFDTSISVYSAPLSFSLSTLRLPWFWFVLLTWNVHAKLPTLQTRLIGCFHPIANNVPFFWKRHSNHRSIFHQCTLWFYCSSQNFFQIYSPLFY